MDTITVENISKKFKIPHEKKTTIFQHLIGIVKRQFEYEEFWALRDISFTVRQGETFGIIGPNGSGKSTLLKMLARVLYPDSGCLFTRGRIASFLELGVGFQPELTAEENVFLYSSILGMSRRDVRRRYFDIFDFAELHKFRNMKLKNFSSGMYLRLAFSTAVFADPETLLVDEVLAVGDEAFQKKCTRKIDEFREKGKTIILVSHSLDTVRNNCQRSLLLDHGRMVSLGETEKVVRDYQSIIKGDKPHV